MDLKALTRDELVLRASERGIEGAEYLTHDELLRVLGVVASPSALAGARKWFRGLIATFVDSPAAPAQAKTNELANAEHIANAESDATHTEVARAEGASHEEPIRTMTMARLLVEQGHVERARLILSELDSKAETPANVSAARTDDTHVQDAVTAEVLDAQTLAVTWTISERGKSRARRLLDANGTLTLRVVAIESHRDGGVRSRLLTFTDVDDAGTKRIDSVASGATCLAAVGLSTNGRFVAIAHAPRRALEPVQDVANTSAPDVVHAPHAARTDESAITRANLPAQADLAPAVLSARHTITQSGAAIAPRPPQASSASSSFRPGVPVRQSDASARNDVPAHDVFSGSTFSSDAIWAVANTAPPPPAHAGATVPLDAKRTSAAFLRN